MCTPRSLWETPEVTTAANAMCQLANEPQTHRNRPTAARAVAQLQQLPQVQRQTRFLWETPEVTTVRAAIRTMAACQLANEPSDPPIRGCRTAPAAPTGVLCTPGLPWETPEATTAAMRTIAACQSANEPADPPLSRLSHSSSISHRYRVGPKHVAPPNPRGRRRRP
jgi:hypothetical protein